MFMRITLIPALAVSFSLAAIQPADRVSADTTLYVEGAPLSEGIGALRTLVGTIAGEGIWSMLQANVEQKSGINMLEPAKLEELGINTKVPWALAVNFEMEATGTPGKPEFVMIIPVQNNAKFYDFLKAKITESQMQINKEMEPGRLLYFGTESDPGYLLRSDDALLVSNKLELVKAAGTSVGQPISSAPFYTTMRTHLLARNKNKPPLAAFYLNPKLIVSSLKIQTEMLKQLQKELNGPGENAPALDENSPYLAEIRDNLQSSGGALVATGEKISFYFSYKYKEGYLADKGKIYPRIIQVKTQPLASDTAARNPYVYTMLKINIMGIIDLLKSLSPVFTEKYGKAMAEANEKLQYDFEKKILASLRGNFGFQLLNFPAEGKTKDYNAWEMYGAFGIKEGSAVNWLSFFKALEKVAKQAEASKKDKTKFAYDETDTGKFVTITGTQGVGERKKKITVVFLISDTEVIVSNSKLNAIKATKGTETTLSDRLMRLSYDATQGIFFLDLQQILKAMLKTKEGAALKNYAQMMEKMKSFSVISSIQGDFATAETTLFLRK